ncbi:MAG: hypothetical protein K2X90_03815 [Candidatus Babeliaceae bacterium]|nr:hypothetical protein [Candidatus Babeliaceae bacterium]
MKKIVALIFLCAQNAYAAQQPRFDASLFPSVPDTKPDEILAEDAIEEALEIDVERASQQSLSNAIGKLKQAKERLISKNPDLIKRIDAAIKRLAGQNYHLKKENRKTTPPKIRELVQNLPSAPTTLPFFSQDEEADLLIQKIDQLLKTGNKDAITRPSVEESIKNFEFRNMSRAKSVELEEKIKEFKAFIMKKR